MVYFIIITMVTIVSVLSFYHLVKQDRVAHAFIVLTCFMIIMVSLAKNHHEGNGSVQSEPDDCQSQATWVDQNVGYNMVFKFKDGERYSYQSVIRIDGTAETEYRVYGNSECELYKKAIPIIKTFREAQKQVEEEE